MITIEKKITEFPLKLRRVREARGMMMRTVAGRCFISYKLYQKYETGFCFPTIPGLLDICNALQCTPNDLLGY